MPDRKNVINQIEKCIHDNTCVGCPYENSLACRYYMLSDALALLKEQKQIKTYGKMYYVSPKVAIENSITLEKKLYEDICKCLIENGVLVIHSEENPVDVTYGWKLKGVTVELEKNVKRCQRSDALSEVRT